MASNPAGLTTTGNTTSSVSRAADLTYGEDSGRKSSLLVANKPSVSLGASTSPDGEVFPASKGEEKDLRALDGTDVREQCQALARRARDAFKDACTSTTDDEVESHHLAMRTAIETLWRFAKFRDLPFRDLLALVDAATKYKEISSFSDTQKDVIRSALSDMPVWGVGYEAVDAHIAKFTDFHVDITGPVRTKRPKAIRITIEELQDE